MGVMSCHRHDCDNIMCNTYVYAVGYICPDCQDEFIEWLKQINPLYLDSEKFISDKLKEFMETTKNPHHNIDETIIREFFRKNTDT